jgi:hypothetical protein
LPTPDAAAAIAGYSKMPGFGARRFDETFHDAVTCSSENENKAPNEI